MYRQWLKDWFSPAEIAQLKSQQESQHTSPEAAEELLRRLDSMEQEIDPRDVSAEETRQSVVESSQTLRSEPGSSQGHGSGSDSGSGLAQRVQAALGIGQSQRSQPESILSQRLPSDPGSSQTLRLQSSDPESGSQRLLSALGIGQSQRSQSSEPGTSHSQRLQSGLSSIRSSEVEVRAGNSESPNVTTVMFQDSASKVPDNRPEDITSEVMQTYKEKRDKNAIDEYSQLEKYREKLISDAIVLTPGGSPVKTRTRSDLSYEAFMHEDPLERQKVKAK